MGYSHGTVEASVEAVCERDRSCEQHRSLLVDPQAVDPRDARLGFPEALGFVSGRVRVPLEPPEEPGADADRSAGVPVVIASISASHRACAISGGSGSVIGCRAANSSSRPVANASVRVRGFGIVIDLPILHGSNLPLSPNPKLAALCRAACGIQEPDLVRGSSLRCGEYAGNHAFPASVVWRPARHHGACRAAHAVAIVSLSDGIPPIFVISLAREDRAARRHAAGTRRLRFRVL